MVLGSKGIIYLSHGSQAEYETNTPQIWMIKIPKNWKKGDLVKTLSVPNVWPETSRIIFCIFFCNLEKTYKNLQHELKKEAYTEYTSRYYCTNLNHMHFKK